MANLENDMIDSAMLVRLMNQIGYYKELAKGGADTLLPLAKAIWNAAQAEEREACAKACEAEKDPWAHGGYDSATRDCAAAIRMRSNALAQGREPQEKRPTGAEG